MSRLATAAALLLFAVSSAAFAPATMGSTFVQTRTTTGTTAFVVSDSPRRSTTALQMNIFDRFTRVAKANINNVLKSLEEPEKILTQALEDMQVRVLFFSFTQIVYRTLSYNFTQPILLSSPSPTMHRQWPLLAD